MSVLSLLFSRVSTSEPLPEQARRSAPLPVLRTTLLAAATLVAVAPAAQAGTVSLQNGTLTYVGTAGDDTPSISIVEGSWAIADWSTGAIAGAGCTQSESAAGLGTSLAYCAGAATSVVIQTGDGTDVAEVEDLPAAVVVTVNLGSGTNSYDGHRGGRDVVTSGSGGDRIYTYGGDDSVSSGGGTDEIRTSSGNDYVNAGAGRDWVYDDAGTNTLLGGGDRDVLFGGSGVDTMRGGSGNDDLYGAGNADKLYGDGGNDRLVDDRAAASGFVGDRLYGGTGSDTVDYSYRLSSLSGAAPLKLTLDGKANDGRTGEGDNIGPDGSIENIIGGGVADVIVGNGAGNRLVGHYGKDVISGNGGNDALYGSEGNDTLRGNRGSDYINGGSGHDVVYGNRGDDKLHGWYGNDRIFPGAGRDSVNAGRGDDVIDSRDGVGETIECSWGWDKAYIDRADRPSAFCERVYKR